MAKWISFSIHISWLLWWLSSKEPACNARAAGAMSSIPRSGRSAGGGHGNPLQYSCLENSMDRGAWRATVCCSVASVASDSVRPHRWQPTRRPRPWVSPGKNTGVGCHFLLQCMKVKSESEVAQSYPTLSDPMDSSSPGSSVHGIFQARVLEWGAIAVYRVAKSWTWLKRLSTAQHTHIPSPLSGFTSHFGHHRELSRVPWAIRLVLIGYLFYT